MYISHNYFAVFSRILVFISHTLVVLAIGVKYVRRTAYVAHEFDNKSRSDCVRGHDLPRERKRNDSQWGNTKPKN
jgi:hypothetical protein